jgi:hypothetical protein
MPPEFIENFVIPGISVMYFRIFKAVIIKALDVSVSLWLFPKAFIIFG